MWIETASMKPALPRSQNSFASNGECGLKRSCKAFRQHSTGNSFASNGECGLKHVISSPLNALNVNSFASNGECGLKPFCDQVEAFAATNSFASNGECGLKHQHGHRGRPRGQFIRQQWRMWIETECSALQKRRD